MIRRNEFVLNSPTYMDTGKPVRDLIQIETPTGMVVNVEASDEPPLRLPRCACNNGRPAFDRQKGDPAGVRADPNFADGAFSLDLGVVDGRANVFGAASSGEDLNADTYDDAAMDSADMEGRRQKLRADLGLTTEENPERARQQRDAGIRSFPGAPAKSFG